MAQSMTNAVTGSYEDVVSRFFDPVRSASTRFPAGEKGNQVKIGTPGISREREREREKKKEKKTTTHQFRRFLTKHREELLNVCRSITFKGRLSAGLEAVNSSTFDPSSTFFTSIVLKFLLFQRKELIKFGKKKKKFYNNKRGYFIN